MTMYHVGYDPAGRIVCASDNADPPTVLGAPLAWLQVEADAAPSSANSYVANGAIVSRLPNPATITGTSLSNLPAPCTIHVEDEAYGCDEATATLSLPPGEYRVTVSAWPYLDAVFEVRV